MKYVACTLAANAVSITCVCCAAYLSVKDKEGWGWFLLVALMCATTIGHYADK